MSASIARWQCPPRSVLAAVDFGEASARALAVAQVIGSAFGARLDVLHAERFEPPPYFTLEQLAALDAERHQAEAATMRHLVQFAAAAGATPVDYAIVDAPPVDAILDASAKADLIVVGTHGRRGPGRWWLGSVAERILRAADVPVLVTRAATTPPRLLFERVAVTHDEGGSHPLARTYAEQLAGIVGATATVGGELTKSDITCMREASLIVMSIHHGRQSWGIRDAIAKTLGDCQRPVLFIPGDSSRK